VVRSLHGLRNHGKLLNGVDTTSAAPVNDGPSNPATDRRFLVILSLLSFLRSSRLVIIVCLLGGELYICASWKHDTISMFVYVRCVGELFESEEEHT